MEIDSTPLRANLYLYDHEIDFFSGLIITNKLTVIKFRNFSCLINDGSNLNNSVQFSQFFYVL